MLSNTLIYKGFSGELDGVEMWCYLLSLSLNYLCFLVILRFVAIFVGNQ